MKPVKPVWMTASRDSLNWFRFYKRITQFHWNWSGTETLYSFDKCVGVCLVPWPGSFDSFGRPGVDCHVEHENEFAVIQLLFLINEVWSRTLILHLLPCCCVNHQPLSSNYRNLAYPTAESRPVGLCSAFVSYLFLTISGRPIISKESATLARPAAPLTAGVRKISFCG